MTDSQERNSASISLEIDNIRIQAMRERKTIWYKIQMITTDRGTVHQIIDIIEDGQVNLEIITQTEVTVEAVIDLIAEIDLTNITTKVDLIDVTMIRLEVKVGHEAKCQDLTQEVGLHPRTG